MPRVPQKKMAMAGKKESKDEIAVGNKQVAHCKPRFCIQFENPLTLSISKRIKIKVELSLHRMTVFNLHKTTKSSTGKYCQSLDQPETYQ